MITQEELKRLLNYDPDTGIFTWKEDRLFNKLKGKIAGNLSHTGYVYITIYNKAYRAHRLAWLYVYGELPRMLDHKNRIRNDNRISNLRTATHAENSHNRSITKINKITNARGVRFRYGKYYAYIWNNNKYMHLGVYFTLEEAIKVREEKAKELYGDFALDLMENTQENKNGLV